MASCKKEKTCVCTTTGADGYEQVTKSVMKGTKKNLKDACGTRVENLAGGTTETTGGVTTISKASTSATKCELD